MVGLVVGTAPQPRGGRSSLLLPLLPKGGLLPMLCDVAHVCNNFISMGVMGFPPLCGTFSTACCTSNCIAHVLAVRLDL